MNNENENSSPDEYKFGEMDEYGNFATKEEEKAFELQCEETERTARALLNFLEEQNNQKEAIDETVLSLYKSAIDSASSNNPIDFSQILATNTRILNAGFEHYLIDANPSVKPKEKTDLALKMQSQLVRTIEAWSRLKTIQKKFENQKTN